MDEIKIIQEQKQQADGTKNIQDTNLMVFTAGLSTSHSNFPGIKTVFYQPTPVNTNVADDNYNNKWVLSDYIAFNFTQDKNKKTNSLLIKPLYTYRDTYCNDHINPNNTKTTMLDCLQGKSLADLVNNMQKYYTNGNPNFSAIILSPNDVYVQDK